MKTFYLLILAILLMADFAQAQYTPESGSAEREAIVDGLRIPVKLVLKKPVMFRVDSLRVQDGWATISATLLKPDGSPFDWSGTKWERSWRSGQDFEGGVQALLRKRGNAWQVSDYVIDATDWSMGEACRKRKCPSVLR
jgi:hypothetical protein